MTRYPINLGLLDALRAPQVFTQVDESVSTRLSLMPEVLDRVRGCVHFCYLTKPGSKQYGETSPKAHQKFLRAALCEFGSIGDAAKLDFTAQGRDAPGLRQLAHPQIHIVRLLRHANIHLAASVLSPKSRPATWQGPDGPVEFKHSHFVVANIASTVQETDRAGDYEQADLNRMIQWLEDQQREWGIANAVHRTAELYATVLADYWDIAK